MTATVYQIRDYQPTATQLRLLQIRIDETARELVALGLGFCGNLDTAPSEMNPDDSA